MYGSGATTQPVNCMVGATGLTVVHSLPPKHGALPVEPPEFCDKNQLGTSYQASASTLSAAPPAMNSISVDGELSAGVFILEEFSSHLYIVHRSKCTGTCSYSIPLGWKVMTVEV